MAIYIPAVMTVFKPLFRLLLSSKSNIDGLPILLNLLDNHHPHQGILTISNHISTLDDPLAWAIMPFRTFFEPSKVRWTLGAADILFTNRFISPLFEHGQVIKTVRGMGIYQAAIDQAIEKLDDSKWVHIFPEGRVNQDWRNEHSIKKSETCNGKEDDEGRLLRFKWGVSRLVLESKVAPLILPIWLQGFDQVMPEGRKFPFKFFPRVINRTSPLAIKICPPISNSWIDQLRSQYRSLAFTRPSSSSDVVGPDSSYHSGSLNSDQPNHVRFESELQSESELELARRQIRIEVAEILRSELWNIRPRS